MKRHSDNDYSSKDDDNGFPSDCNEEIEFYDLDSVDDDAPTPLLSVAIAR